MADKAVVNLIITAGIHTNRSFVARSFAQMLTELGFEVDMSHVGVHDYEPHVGGEKDEDIEASPSAKFKLSEHYVGTPIQLDQTRGVPQPLVRPAVPQLLGRDETSVAVLGGPNTGKSTLLHMFGDFLKSKEVEEECIQYAMIGEDYFAAWSSEELMHNMQNVKANSRVVFYTRRSYASEPLEMVLASTDGYSVTKEVGDEDTSLPQ